LHRDELENGRDHGCRSFLWYVMPNHGNYPVLKGAGEEARLARGVWQRRDTIAASMQRNRRHPNHGECGQTLLNRFQIGIAGGVAETWR
jgi:hypothetical protein